MSRKILLLVIAGGFVAGILASWPALALAGDEKQLWWQVLVTELIKLFVLVAVPVLSSLTVVLLKRWGIKVESEQVEKLAGAAAGFAEQKAIARLGQGQPRTSGAQKMKDAIDFGRRNLDQYGLPARAIAKLEDLIEAHLGKERVKEKTPKKPASPPAEG